MVVGYVMVEEIAAVKERLMLLEAHWWMGMVDDDGDLALGSVCRALRETEERIHKVRGGR